MFMLLTHYHSLGFLGEPLSRKFVTQISSWMLHIGKPTNCTHTRTKAYWLLNYARKNTKACWLLNCMHTWTKTCWLLKSKCTEQYQRCSRNQTELYLWNIKKKVAYKNQISTLLCTCMLLNYWATTSFFY